MKNVEDKIPHIYNFKLHTIESYIIYYILNREVFSLHENEILTGKAYKQLIEGIYKEVYVVPIRKQII